MGHRRRTTGWLITALLLSLSPGVAIGGEWHRDATLACTDCHTMHNSKDGQPMRYDGSTKTANLLLRADGATYVCLACHKGDRPTVNAPGVGSPSNWDPPGGGFPGDLGDPGHHAHALGTQPMLPPYGDTAVVMTCVTCHEQHGNAAYRNLRASPSGTGRATAPVVAQLVTADGSNSDRVYVRANVRYVSGMSQWCMDCHNLIAADHSSTPHPWDRPIFGAVAADWSIWSGTVLNRTAVQNALGAAAPDEGDQVFCLSCHKAHGSPNDAALVYADASAMSSTCLQCHDM